MVARQYTQPDRRTVVIEATDEAQASTLLVGLLPVVLQRRIQQRQAGHRIRRRERGERIRYQRGDLYLLGAQCDAAGARQDQQLAPDIFTGEIHARVRLGVTGVGGLTHIRGERTLAIVVMEQPRQRTGQHAFHAVDAVATGNQRAQAAQQRQASTDRRTVAVARVALLAAVGDGLGTGQLGPLAKLVGGHHVHATRQPLFVPVGDLVTGGRIDHHVPALQAFGFRPGLQCHRAARSQVGLGKFVRGGLFAGARRA